MPEAVIDRLRQRAAHNHRSMQGELMALICQAVEVEREPERPRRPRDGGPRQGGTVSIEEIATEHRARWPEPFDQAPRAADVIRGDRDAR